MREKKQKNICVLFSKDVSPRLCLSLSLNVCPPLYFLFSALISDIYYYELYIQSSLPIFPPHPALCRSLPCFNVFHAALHTRVTRTNTYSCRHEQEKQKKRQKSTAKANNKQKQMFVRFLRKYSKMRWIY